MKVAFQSILRHRMRSFLTMLGIIIGVGAVIALVSIGNGAQVQVQNQIASLGTNLLMIMPWASQSGGVSKGAGTMNNLTLDNLDAIQKKATLLQGISPEIRENFQVIAGARNWSTSIEGVSATFLDIRNWSLEQGAFFTERDLKSRNKVAVLGKTVVTQLFSDQNPLGASIRIGEEYL